MEIKQEDPKVYNINRECWTEWLVSIYTFKIFVQISSNHMNSFHLVIQN